MASWIMNLGFVGWRTAQIMRIVIKARNRKIKIPAKILRNSVWLLPLPWLPQSFSDDIVLWRGGREGGLLYKRGVVLFIFGRCGG